MQPPQKHSWINLAELKDHLTSKLGSEKSNQYFDYLKRFLSLKLSKNEFNKLCLSTLGRDNISLHNQFIRSALKSACTRKVPPPKHNHHSTTVGNNKFSNEVYHENGRIPAVKTKYPTESLSRKSGVRKASSWGCNSNFLGILDINGLRVHMEQLAATQGLKGVSMDCASVLNNGLDAYLKGLIRSFAELNRARIKHHAHLSPLNGISYQIETRNWSLETIQENEAKHSISLLDFTVAMELNPQQLGEDWPILLEKICTSAF